MKPATPNGFSLVEVLIAVAIMSVAALGFSRLMATHVEQQIMLAQKLEMLDLKNELLSIYNSPAACSCMLNATTNTTNAFPLTFNASAANASLQLSTIYGGCDVSLKPTSPLATAGQPLPGTTTNLHVKSIQLTNINPTGSANPNEYVGTFEINFDPKTLAISRHPVTFQQRFYADASSPTTARTIAYCGTPGVTSFGGMYSTSSSATCVDANPITSACSCPLGYNAQPIASSLTGDASSIYYCLQ